MKGKVRLALLALCFVLGCQAPADRQLSRPQAVPATSFEQRDVNVNGLRLRYIDVGTSRPGQLPLLLIHGHTSRIEEYEALVRTLSKDMRVLVPDLPGSGYSDKPARDYSLRFFEDTLLAFLDTVGVDRANLAGGSQGGNLTLRLGHRAPQRFERLVPWAPASSWPSRPWVAGLTRAVASYTMFWPIVKVQSRYWYRDDFAEKDELLRRTFSYYDEVMCEGFVRMYFGLAADQMEFSLQDIASEIHQPTLLLWGDQDHGGGMGDGVQRLHALLPNNRLRVFTGAGHALANEKPAELSDEIRSFLLPAP